MPLKYERGDLAAKNIKSKYTATVPRVEERTTPTKNPNSGMDKGTVWKNGSGADHEKSITSRNYYN